MILADTITFGAVAGTIAFVIGLVASIGFFMLGRRARYDAGFFYGGGALGVALAVLIYVWAMWPFSHDYHHWIDKKGEVQSTAKRIISDGDGGISERFVLTIDGVPYGVDDTRAAAVKVGDTVQIRCKRAFEWGTPREAHGWTCRWAGVTR